MKNSKVVLNYQQCLDSEIEKIKENNNIPGLLLHSCCAPCSTYVLEYLSKYFSITVFFYNPNIHPEEEYQKRLNEQRKLISILPTVNKVDFIEGEYEPDVFFNVIRGLENEPEGKKRCLKCFELRLMKVAQKAKELNFPYFTTTLTVSPHKNASLINEIGQTLSKTYSINFLCSDFKKKNGFKRSVILSQQYGLYRQNYCGCIFSNRKENKIR